MGIREWIADNIAYRFGDCGYAKGHDKIFDPLEKLVPKNFKNRKISDLGCGDGQNTLRIKKIFNAKEIVGYERNPHLVKQAQRRGIKTTQMDLTKKIPQGEMATFSFALHHIKDKDKVGVLKKVANNFDYIFLIEPVNDIWHVLFDGGDVLSRKGWIKVFDKALGKYQLHQQGKHLAVFYIK